MHIVGIKAENFKKLKAIEIIPNPDQSVVVIGGRNAQGKSAVLDAIFAALGGGAGKQTQPIRDGQDHAIVTVDLGDYIVTRRWTKDDAGTVTVTAPDGAKYSSPQKLLDEVIGTRSLDVMAFLRADAKQQVTTLLEVLGDSLSIDPDQLTRERKGVFDTRTDVSREVKKLEGQLAGFPLPDPDLPTVEISGSDVLTDIDALQRERRDREQKEATLAQTAAGLTSTNQEIIALEGKLSELRASRAAREASAANLADELADQRTVEAIDADAVALREKLKTVDSTNARIRRQNERASIAADLATQKAKAAQLTIKLNEIDKKRRDGLAAAKFPTPGLSFDETGVTLHGVPFSQASAAEKRNVALDLAMDLADSKLLKVLRLEDGSLLDDSTLAEVTEKVQGRGFQLWLEMVGDTGVGFVIEAGQVAA